MTKKTHIGLNKSHQPAANEYASVNVENSGNSSKIINLYREREAFAFTVFSFLGLIFTFSHTHARTTNQFQPNQIFKVLMLSFINFVIHKTETNCSILVIQKVVNCKQSVYRAIYKVQSKRLGLTASNKAIPTKANQTRVENRK